uniref:Uncharacterized protein n=1 Tax=Anopheles minimus TaxID=112268 RepID=A0A182WN13_9DIPT
RAHHRVVGGLSGRAPSPSARSVLFSILKCNDRYSLKKLPQLCKLFSADAEGLTLRVPVLLRCVAFLVLSSGGVACGSSHRSQQRRRSDLGGDTFRVP